MPFLRILAIVFGISGIVIGLLWVGQGTGIISWPAQSMMIDDRSWAIRGAIMAAVGSVLLWLARRGNGSNDNRL